VADIALQWNLAAGCADMRVSGPDLLRDDGIETAILLSLFCDARANTDDNIPDGSTNPRGWWADQFAETTGDRWGSRWWLLDRSKPTPNVLKRREDYGREALAWLITDGVAARVDVKVEHLPGAEALGRLKALGGRLILGGPGVVDGYFATVTIYRPQTPTAGARYHLNWQAQLGG
jgi:phage gp46-like protein